MSVESKKILEMVAEGKITADDAEKLLEKVTGSPTARADNPQSGESGDGGKRYLRISIDRPGDEEVNVRVPLAFIRSGTMLGALLPAKVSAQLAAKGIDLSALSGLHGHELINALHELNVDVDRKDGKKVRIFCE